MVHIEASVKGSHQEDYFVDIEVGIESHMISSVHGDCSCPVGFFCKHMVAAIYKAEFTIEEEIPPAAQESERVSEWFDTLCLDQTSVSEPAENEKELILYSLSQSEHDQSLAISLMLAKWLKSNRLGKAYPLSPDSTAWLKHATEEDANFLLELRKNSQYPGVRSYFIPYKSPSSGMIFEKLVNSGRALWDDGTDQLLKMAEPRTVQLNWEIQENGDQKLQCTLEEDASLLPLTPPYYLSKEGECGLVQARDIEGSLLSSLIKTPAIPFQDIPNFCQKLKEKKLNLPEPRPVVVERKKERPKLHLELIGVKNAYPYQEGAYPLVIPYFLYGTNKIPVEKFMPSTTRLEGEKLIVIERSEKEEKKLLNDFFDRYEVSFTTPYFTPYQIEKKYPYAIDFERPESCLSQKLSFLAEAIPVWKKEYSFQIDSSFPYEFLGVGEDDWYCETTSDAQMNWFDLELGLEFEGKKINLLPTLTKIIQEKPKLFSAQALEEMNEGLYLTVVLDGGKVVRIPMDKLKGILLTLAEINDPNSLSNQKLKLSRLRAGELLGLSESLNLKWKAGEVIKEFAQKLQNFQGIQKVSPPKKLKTELRPYQNEGLNWLQFLSQHALGGILADDMGLGKTIQTLAHLCLEKEKLAETKPSLIIAPTSLMVNWNQEVEKFAPHLKTLTLHGPERKEVFDLIPKHDLIFTTYPLLSRDKEELLKHEYHALIFDEAQMVKNPLSKAAKVCRELRAHHRICLSGTPMENHLDELWSLSEISNPGLLGTPKQFKKIFRTPIEKHGAIGAQKTLAKRMAPFLMRRTKDKVALDLPEKTEIVKTIELEGEQKKLYEGIRLSMHKKVTEALHKKGIASSQILILDALLKLRQACCDPRLVKLENAKKVKESAKLSFLIDMVKKLVEEGRKILLFSSFTSMLALIEEELNQLKIPYSKITGETKDRKTPVVQFQNGDVPLFLISLKAGGTGLNLTAADTVIHYDPWWNPAAENQATDRAHRIGQEKPVFVYKLITQRTVEEKILKMQERKKALVDGVLDQKEQKHSSLTLEDIEYLFEPMA